MKSSLLLMNLLKLIKKKGYFLPKSCEYLFFVFCKECETVNGDYVITLQDWVDLWFRDDLRYKVLFSMNQNG
jgi:hypothetical protein